MDFLSFGAGTASINRIISDGAKTIMSEKEFFEREIIKWKGSKKRQDMLTAENYYEGEHDILSRKRMIIGENGELVEAKNLPNNKLVDNQYALLVDKKVNYMFAKPLTFDSESKDYIKCLKKVFNKKFHRTFRNIGLDAINDGISWIYPYYDDQGNFTFKRFPSYEILPFWKDAEHTILELAVRLYQVEAYEGTQEKIIEKVEIYDINGVHRFELRDNALIPDLENASSHHVTKMDSQGNEQGFNWLKVPLVAFKANSKEIPLIRRVKSLQDAINIIFSDFENNMQEDARNTILVLHNYEGTNLGEFRKNLSQYGVVKVKTIEGVAGDLKTLTVEVDSENYKIILELLKKALIENGRGYDAKNERMSNNPNQMNIQSMYSDVDLDANGMETEFQASFEELLWFVNQHFENTGQGNFENEEVDIILNRDILINETETIENCSKSVGLLSDETVVSQHPWISDVKTELKRKKDEAREQQSEMDQYKEAFGQHTHGQGGDGINEE